MKSYLKRLLIALPLIVGLNSQILAQCTVGPFFGTIRPMATGSSYTSQFPVSPGYSYQFFMLQGGSYRISTCGAPINTQLTLYLQSNTAPGQQVAYNDDNGPDCNGLNASMDFTATASVQYRMMVSRFNCQVNGGGAASITLKYRQNDNLNFLSSNADMMEGASRTLSANPSPIVSPSVTLYGPGGIFTGTGVSGTTFLAPTPTGGSQTYNIDYTFGWATKTQNVTVYRFPVADAGSDFDLCDTATNLAANLPWGTGVWRLISGSGFIADTTSATSLVDSLAPGQNVFEWTVNNGPAPAVKDTIVITRFEIPTAASAGLDENICGQSYSLLANTPVIGNGEWLQVSGPGSLSFVDSSLSTTTVTSTAFGTHELEWTITNGNCPVARDTLSLTFFETPTVSVAGVDDSVCGQFFTTAANAPSVGTAVWTSTGGPGVLNFGNVNAPITSASITNYGTYSMAWTISNGNCPASSDTILVSYFDSPTVSNAGMDVSTCLADTILTANSPTVGTGLWSVVSGSASISSPANPTSSITGMSVGVNEFIWTISNGACPAERDSVTVTRLIPAAAVDLGADTAFCTGGSLTIGVTPDPGCTYLWNTSANTPTIVVNTVGIYSLVCFSVDGCTDEDSIDVTSISLPSAGFSTTDSCPTIFFTNSSTDADTYLWKFGEGSTSTSPDASFDYSSAGNGTYSVVLISTGVCGVDSTSQQVTVSCIVGLNKTLELSDIRILPNPSNGRIRIQLDQMDQKGYIQIVDALGKLVYRGEIQNDKNGLGVAEIDLSGLPSGQYLAYIVVGERRGTEKVILR
jgi:Secretion system C-terminal sorting domain